MKKEPGTTMCRARVLDVQIRRDSMDFQGWGGDVLTPEKLCKSRQRALQGLATADLLSARAFQ